MPSPLHTMHTHLPPPLHAHSPPPPHTCTLTPLHTHAHSPPPYTHPLAQVFHQIVYGLREATSRSSLVDDKICEGYFFLAELCDMRPDSNNYRPICQLVRTYLPLHLLIPTYAFLTPSPPHPYTHTHKHTHTSLAQTKNGFRKSRGARLRARHFLVHFSVSQGSWTRVFPSVVGIFLRATVRKTQRICLTPFSRGLASVG